MNLDSQRFRVAAANSIETRFPFLDHRIVEFGAKIPPKYKIFGLKEKFVLKKAMARELPDNIINRVKQPYMAPDSNSFFQADSPSYIEEMLSEKALADAGVFNPVFVARLKAKCAKLSHAHLSFKDNMSIIGILSTQILISQFVEGFRPAANLDKGAFRIWHDETIETPV